MVVATVPAGVSALDALPWAIGKVVQLDVFTEFMLRTLARDFGADPDDLPPVWQPTLNHVRTLLAQHALPPLVAGVVSDALDAADAAHQTRNRVAHDLWLDHGDGRWFAHSQHPAIPPFANGDAIDLEAILEAMDEVARAQIRVHGCSRLLFAVRSPVPHPVPMEDLLRVARGDFTLVGIAQWSLD